ncbi:hypothetical protein DDW44_17820 [Streptomyces tirandamycinicus]|uniref:Uncharacterized protein n=1 Tax=Streptomyces tirandamycinicus TaxID=2174846 RepID=A0A2S1SVM3_9ACTN|nr:hypothetical protein DDW44_17820 [Streptomyces tirandamycinicus]
MCLNGLEGQVAVVAFSGHEVSIWQRDADSEGTTKQRQFDAGDQDVSAVACVYKDDSAVRVVTGHVDGSVRMQTILLESGPVDWMGMSEDEVRPEWAVAGAHVSAVSVVACTTVGERPAAVTAGGTGDNTLHVWDLASGGPGAVIETGHSGGISGLAIATIEGQTTAVTAGGIGDGVVRAWDLASGEMQRAFPIGPDTVTALTSSPDGRFLFTGHWDGEVKMWDLRTGYAITRGWHRSSSSRYRHELTESTHAPITSLAYAVTGGQPAVLIAHENGMADVRSLTRSQPVGELIPRHPAGIVAVDSAVMDGRPVAMTAGTRGDNMIRFWDLTLGHRHGTPQIGHGTEVIGTVVFGDTADDSLIVSVSSDATVRLAPATVPLEEHTVWSADCEEIADIAFCYVEGRPAAAALVNGALQCWDILANEERFDVSQLDPHTRLTNSAVACTTLEGRAVAVTAGSAQDLRLWDMATGQLVQRWRANRRDMHSGALACCTVDGVPIVVAGMYIWELATGTSRRLALREDLNLEQVTAVGCMSLSGEPLVVVGFSHGKAGVWRLRDGSFHGLLDGHVDAISAITCTTLGKRPVAITGSRDRTVRIWDLRDARVVDVLPMPEPVGALAAGSGGTLVVGSGLEVIVMEQGWGM